MSNHTKILGLLLLPVKEPRRRYNVVARRNQIEDESEATAHELCCGYRLFNLGGKEVRADRGLNFSQVGIPRFQRSHGLGIHAHQHERGVPRALVTRHSTLWRNPRRVACTLGRLRPNEATGLFQPVDPLRYLHDLLAQAKLKLCH